MPAQRTRQKPRSENKDRQREIEDVTKVALRPLASPLPLAFLAFGVGSAMQSALQLGLIPQSESANLALVFGALAFPPLIQAAIFTATLHSAWLSGSKTWSTESLYLWSVAAMRPWPSRAAWASRSAHLVRGRRAQAALGNPVLPATRRRQTPQLSAQ